MRLNIVKTRSLLEGTNTIAHRLTAQRKYTTSILAAALQSSENRLVSLYFKVHSNTDVDNGVSYVCEVVEKGEHLRRICSSVAFATQRVWETGCSQSNSHLSISGVITPAGVANGTFTCSE